ncbi:helix-turn-helix domain-containing protein [Mediterraneibacter gnavus]|uniref:helix-turn-helix domain-containing protein n=1 Tax=Mediterraneibacter gnavus TaxID=33038 RepID=UPI0023B8DBB7
MLIDKGMKKMEFAQTVGISTNTLAKLSHNKKYLWIIIIRICRKLNCTVDEILDIVPESKVTNF